MARSKEPTPRVGDHFAPFVKGLEEYMYRAATLYLAADTALALLETINMDGNDPAIKIKARLKDAIDGFGSVK